MEAAVVIVIGLVCTFLALFGEDQDRQLGNTIIIKVFYGVVAFGCWYALAKYGISMR